jgi:hypothetical protein
MGEIMFCCRSLLAVASRFFLALLILQLLKMKTKYYSKISKNRILQLVMHLQIIGQLGSFPARISHKMLCSNHARLPM